MTFKTIFFNLKRFASAGILVFMLVFSFLSCDSSSDIIEEEVEQEVNKQEEL